MYNSFSFKLKYFLFGVINTVIAYLTSISLYYCLSNVLNIILISLASYFISISITFLTYKLFVFNSKGNWLLEYFRCFIVYGFVIITGIILTFLLFNFFHIAFWITQILVILLGAFISFFSH